MKQIAIIKTPYVGDGTDENPFRSKLNEDFNCSSVSDITGLPSNELPPSPNIFTVEVIAESAVIDAIAQAGDYTVLSREDIQPLEE